MIDWLLAHEAAVRLSSFAGIFLLMAVLELVARRRPLRLPKGRRWLANLSLVVVNTLLLRLLIPTAAVGLAALATQRGLGLLQLADLPETAEIVLAVVMLDLAIYLQHVMFHAVPVLWRLHMVHHADLDFDVTTGSRFHPVEILLSMGIKLGLVLMIGPPVVAVLVFELLLNGMAMFNHANVRLPLWLDRLLRVVVVTPDLHRVHHSVEVDETNSNFGFNLSCWDRVFGTYRAQPAAGQQAMRIGLSHLQDTGLQGLVFMLLLPFVVDPGAYAINRREWS